MAENRHQPEQLQNLEHAFQTFNELSEQLAGSYQQLQQRVQDLGGVLESDPVDPSRLLEAKRIANRLQSLLEALPGGVVVLDGRGCVQEYNPAAIELLGQPLKGQAWRDVIARAFAPRFDDGHEVSLKDGRRVSISTSSLGREPGQILLIQDMSETRNLLDKLSRYQRLSGMGQMAASLAHQIRTPASAALLYVSQLESKAGDEAVARRCGTKIRAQLQQIESMVSDMLAYVKGESGSGQERRFAVADLLEQVGGSVQNQIEAAGGSLTIKDDAPKAALVGNEDALGGVLINIAMNGLQACGNDPRISIHVCEADGFVTFEISDNGNGIPESIQDKLFEAFVTTRPQGTGLGLAIAQSVVAQHQGTVEFETETGVGTTFIVRIPSAKGDDASDDPGNCDKNNEVVV